MKTCRLTLTENEVAATLPGLEAIANAIGFARLGHFPSIDPRVQFPSSSVHLYSHAEFSETMAEFILTARNQLKWINDSRKVRLCSFKLAAAAFAVRLGQREGLVPADALAGVSALLSKLEKYRRRAKRAAVKEIGDEAYAEQAGRWRRFLQYIRCILCCRPAPWGSRGLRLRHRDQREELLALAMEVAPTADPVRLRHLVDLAKREVLRDRHSTTLGLLLSDDVRGREFMARFILKREGPDVLAPEFQPLDVRQANCGERIKAAMVIDGPDVSAHVVQVQKRPGEKPRNSIKVPIPTVENRSEAPTPLVAPSINQKALPTLEELAALYSEWLLAQADPSYWNAITRQTQLEIWRPITDRWPATVEKPIITTDAEFCPSYIGSEQFELNNLLAIWGAGWLVTMNPDPYTTAKACKEGRHVAGEKWNREHPDDRIMRYI